MKAFKVKVLDIVLPYNLGNLLDDINPQCFGFNTRPSGAIKVKVFLCMRCYMALRILDPNGVNIGLPLKSVVHAVDDILMIRII